MACPCEGKREAPFAIKESKDLTNCATISFSTNPLHVATQNIMSRDSLITTVMGLMTAVLFSDRASTLEHKHFAVAIVIKASECAANSQR